MEHVETKNQGAYLLCIILASAVQPLIARSGPASISTLRPMGRPTTDWLSFSSNPWAGQGRRVLQAWLCRFGYWSRSTIKTSVGRTQASQVTLLSEMTQGSIWSQHARRPSPKFNTRKETSQSACCLRNDTAQNPGGADGSSTASEISARCSRQSSRIISRGFRWWSLRGMPRRALSLSPGQARGNVSPPWLNSHHTLSYFLSIAANAHLDLSSVILQSLLIFTLSVF